MLKNNPLPQSVKRATNVAAPIPRVPAFPVSDPSKVVYAITPSASVSSGPTPTPASGSATPAVGGSEDIKRKIAEAQRRVAVAEANTKLTKNNPYMVCITSARLEFRPSYTRPVSSNGE